MAGSAVAACRPPPLPHHHRAAAAAANKTRSVEPAAYDASCSDSDQFQRPPADRLTTRGWSNTCRSREMTRHNYRSMGSRSTLVDTPLTNRLNGGYSAEGRRTGQLQSVSDVPPDSRQQTADVRLRLAEYSPCRSQPCPQSWHCLMDLSPGVKLAQLQPLLVHRIFCAQMKRIVRRRVRTRSQTAGSQNGESVGGESDTEGS